MAKKKSSSQKIDAKKSTEESTTKTVYDEDNFNEDLKEISTSRKEKMFAISAIAAVSIILLFLLIKGCTPLPDTVDEETLPAQGDEASPDSADEDPEASGEIIGVEEDSEEGSEESLEESSEENYPNGGEETTQQEPDENVPEEDAIEQDNPEETVAEGYLDEGTSLDPGLSNLSLRPACSKGYHMVELSYIFSETPLSITIQLENVSQGGEGFTDLATERAEPKKYIYLYVCDGCPVGDSYKISPGEDYRLRLKIDRFGETYYSRTFDVSTEDDSLFMTKICSSAQKKGDCEDLEYEKNINARGAVKKDGEEFIENCINNTHTEEYWCEDNEVQKEIISCEKICWLGRCLSGGIPPPPS